MPRHKNLLILSLVVSVYFCKSPKTYAEKVDIFLCAYTHTDAIIHLSVNGTHVEEHQLTPSGSAAAIGYDPVEKELYWSDNVGINKINLDDGEVKLVSLLTSYAYGLALDSVARKLFYTRHDTDIIVSMDLNGENALVIFDSSNITHPLALALDEQKRKIFWSDRMGGFRISSSEYDGTNQIIIAWTKGPTRGLTVDIENEFIYWCGYAGIGWVESASYDGSNRRELIFPEYLRYNDIFLSFNTLYITATNGGVYSKPIDSNETTEITTSLVYSDARLYVISEMKKEEKPLVESRLIHTDDLHSELVFLCNFSQHSEDVFYSTSWFVDDNLVLRSNPEKWSNGSVIENQALTETHLREANITTYGIQITCSIEATYEEGNISTPAVMSRLKYVGIQVSTTSVSVFQGASTDITLSLTDPFGCGSYTNNEECKLRIKVNTLHNGDKCEQALLMPSECGASFAASRWDESVSIKLFGKVTNTYGSSSKAVNLKLTTPFMWAHEMWGEAQLSQIQVKLTKDTSHIQWKSCYSNNDPHMRTFDGRHYEHQYDGIFTMYKHLELPLEVQIQTARCSNSQNAWCNCGLAVRAGGTVFEINRCPGQSDIWFIDYTLCDDGGDVLQVKRRGGNYEIYLPTGAKLDVNIYGVFLNVQMFPSVRDTMKSAGLCGKMSEDGACNDDFVLRDGNYSTDPTATDGCSAGSRVWENLLTQFSQSWRAVDGENLFNHPDLSFLENWPQQSTYCTCSEDKELNDPLPEVECSANKAHETCKSIPGYSDVTPSKCSINRRRRRSVNPVLDPSAHIIAKRDTSWPGNWTEETATEHCEQLFQESASIQICQNVTGVDTNGSFESCIQDIKLTGTTDFGKYSVDSVRSKCYHEVVVNPVLQDNENSSDNQSVYDIVVAEACPSDCNGKGNCSEGTCYCWTNYGGLDCSVDLSAPPVLSSVQDDGHCDTPSLSCDVISVYGETFTDGNTTCLIEAFKVTEHGLEHEGSSLTAALVQSISHVMCNINTVREEGETDYVRAFVISVSNDGAVFSNNVSVMVYDGTCVTGYINGTDFSWTKENSSCLYGERCYGNGTNRSDDECKICIFDGSTNSWEHSAASNCTITTVQTTEPTVEQTTELTTESTTEPPTKLTTVPTTASTEEPTTEPTTKPTTEPTTKPTTDQTTKPTTASTEESTTEPTTEPTTDPTTKPTMDTTKDPKPKPTTEQTTEPVTVPTTTQTTESIIEPTTEETTTAETTTVPTTQPTTELTTEPVTTKQTTESTIETTTEETTKSTSGPTTKPTTEKSTASTEADGLKMDFNTITALSVAGGIVGFAVLVAVITFITIKFAKPNYPKMKERKMEKDFPTDQVPSLRYAEWSASRKFIPRPYKASSQLGHI